MDRDLRSIDRLNQKVRAANGPVLEVLQAVTGQRVGRDPDDWNRWWYDQKLANIEAGPVEPVFNLDVARNCTYFVGRNSVLVHDNSLPPPMFTPFDAEPLLELVAHDPPEAAR